jgi:hypothetical protein
VKIVTAFFIRQARINNEKSGTHDDFHMFIMGLPWLLFYHERMNELGDFSMTCSNRAYPCLSGEVFLTSDNSAKCNSSNNTKSNKNKDRSKDLTDAKLRRDYAIAAKNEESKKLLEETQLSLKRKRYNEVLDVLMDVEDKLHEQELKLIEVPGGDEDVRINRHIDLLTKKKENLLAEETHIRNFLENHS